MITIFILCLAITVAASSSPTDKINYILGKEVYSRLDELSLISNEPNIISRPSYSNAQIKASKLVKSWMIDAGMDVHIDCVGNVIGRFERKSFITENETSKEKMCENDVWTLSMGSHYDSVRNAGRFDGTFGVIGAIAVVKAINSYFTSSLPFAIEVIAFEEEEGNNPFDLHFVGSQFYSGTLSFEYPTIDDDLFNIHSRIDPNMTYFQRLSNHFSIMNEREDIVSRKELLSLILSQSHKPRRDIFGFIELHIEQGPVLEYNNKSVGVVTSINGMTILHLDIYGKADHAGTTPMNMRTDALVDAAEIITFLNKLAKSRENLVITVGSINAFPGSVNVIPSKVSFTVDLRIGNNTARYETIDRIWEVMNLKGYNYSLNGRTDVDGVMLLPRSEALVDHLVEATKEYGSFRMPSGALHDAQMMARICKPAMIFTRCKDGISHNPLEFVTLDDIFIGAKALYDSVLFIAKGYKDSVF